MTPSDAAWRRWAPILGVAAPLLVLYGSTLPPGITLEDAGLIAMTCTHGGINHPPGYPLYSLVCPVFAHAPGVEAAVGLAALSALFAAAAAVILARIIEGLGVPRSYAMAGALCYGASLAFWSQAIIPEVYSLNALLAFAIWLAQQRVLEAPTRHRLVLLGAAVGLGLANHWPLVLASGPGLAVLALAAPGRTLALLRSRAAWLAVAGGLALGLLPYLYMYFRLQLPAEIALLPPADGWHDFLRYVARSGYADIDDNPLADAEDQRAYLAWLAPEAARQLGIGMLPIMAVGFVRFAARPAVLAGLGVLLLCHSLVLALMVDFPFDYRWQAIFRPYPLVGWSVLAVLAAGGLATLGSALDRLGRSRSIGRFAAFALVPVVALGNLGYNDRSEATIGERVARTLLESLPPDAVVFTASDEYTGIIGYMHVVRGLRPDVRVLESQGLVYSDRLVPLTGDAEARVAAVDELVTTGTRPVFYVHGVPHSVPHVGYGVMRRLLPPEAEPPRRCRPVEAHLELGLALLEVRPVHPHERFLRQAYLLDLAGCLLGVADRPRWVAVLERLQESHHVATFSLEFLLAREAGAARDAEIARLRERLESMPEPGDLTKSQRSWRHAILGRAALVGTKRAPADLEVAEDHLLRSLAILDRPWNSARRGLARLHALRGDRSALCALLARYPDDAQLDPWRERHAPHHDKG